MPNFLGQFLQEEQEPFSLEVYLLERRCSTGTTSLSSRSHFNSNKIIKRYALKNRRNLIPNCSDFVRAVFKQLGSVTTSLKIKSLSDEDQVNSQENASRDKFLSKTSRIVFGSNTHRIEESSKIFLEEEVDAHGKLTWRRVEDNNRKLLSPVSVLEVAESDEFSPLHYKQRNIKKTTLVESSTSASQAKSRQPASHSTQVLRQIPAASPYIQHIINKRALKQTKQLLIDSVREVIENYRKQQHAKKILSGEELWKLVCENVWLWSQDSIHEANIIHLVHYYFLASAEEWGTDFEVHKKGIWMDLGDAILEDVINEIVEY